MTKKALVPVQAPALVASGLTGATAASRYVGSTVSGAPTSGSFLVGDYVVAQNGAVWICTAAGTPGTWVSPGGVSSVAGRTGAVTLTAADIGAGTFPGANTFTGLQTFDAHGQFGSSPNAYFAGLSSGDDALVAFGVVGGTNTYWGVAGTAGHGTTDSAVGDAVVTAASGATLRLGVAGTASALRITSAGVTIPAGQSLVTGTRTVQTGTRNTTTNASDTVDLGTFSSTGGAIELRIHAHLAAPAAGTTASVTKVYEFAANATMGTASTWFLVLPVDASANAAATNDFALEVQRTALNTFQFRFRQKSIGAAGAITYEVETLGDTAVTFTPSTTVTAAPSAVATIHPSNSLTAAAGNIGIGTEAPAFPLEIKSTVATPVSVDVASGFTPAYLVTSLTYGTTFETAVISSPGSRLTDSVAGDVTLGISSGTMRLGIVGGASTLRVTSSDVQINDNGTARTVPRGLAAAPVQVTTPFNTTTTSSTVAITGASVTFAAVSGRWYEIVFTVPLVYFSAATAVSVATALRIISGSSPPANNTGTQIQDIRSTTAAVAGSTGGQPHSIVTYWQATATGNWTVAAFGVTAGTAGTYNWTCGATSPMNLVVNNVG